jgi:hypothetical protein
MYSPPAGRLKHPHMVESSSGLCFDFIRSVSGLSNALIGEAPDRTPTGFRAVESHFSRSAREMG